MRNPVLSLKTRPLHCYLADSRNERRIIQDLCPLAESIEWKVGQQFYRTHGSSAFNGEDSSTVPYVVNNSGSLSSKAAEVVFASLEAAERSGILEDRIQLLEIGPGIGLFARLFLDRMLALCKEAGKDYYERLVYVAADRSARMLSDISKNGIFENHAGHYLLRVADATEAGCVLARDWSLMRFGQRPFRAVFLNYVLDCLPPAILRSSPTGIEHLCVRTYLRSVTDPKKITRLTVEEIIEKAASTNPSDWAMLEPLFPVWVTSYAFRPIGDHNYPHLDRVTDLQLPNGDGVVFNFGAYQCLESVSRLLTEDGFILINDYGTLDPSVHSIWEGKHQRFSRSTAIGINFPLMTTVAEKIGLKQCFVPSGEQKEKQALYTRLIGSNLPQSVSDTFGSSFDHTKELALDKLRAEIGQCVESGYNEAAASRHEHLLQAEPWNWTQLAQAAHFLTWSLADPLRGLALCRAALRLNPTCSADLWNSLGDSLVLLRQHQAAFSAFRRALLIQPTNARAVYALACLFSEVGDWASALEAVGEALAVDKPQAFTEGLLKLQVSVLTERERRCQEEARQSADHVRWAVELDDDQASPVARNANG